MIEYRTNCSLASAIILQSIFPKALPHRLTVVNSLIGHTGLLFAGETDPAGGGHGRPGRPQHGQPPAALGHRGARADGPPAVAAAHAARDWRGCGTRSAAAAVYRQSTHGLSGKSCFFMWFENYQF